MAYPAQVTNKRESLERVEQLSCQDLDLKELISKVGVVRARDLDYKDGIEYVIQNVEDNPQGSGSQETYGEAPSSEQMTKKDIKEQKKLIIGDRKGQGGFGNVYAANLQTAQTDEELCVKQAKYTGFDALINENEIFSSLKEHPHDHIVERLFLGQNDDFKLMILGLEYVPGMNLSEMVYVCKHKKIPFPHKDTVHILRQQNDAIKFLRDNGIMHCDIKPENIIYNRLTKKSKLIDFGLAMFKTGLNEQLVKRHGGTTEFMAIETLIDHELHVHSDIYGLGATLYNLAMLECPWHFLPTIQELYSQKFDPADPNYKLNKEQRRSDVRVALLQEISEYRKNRNSQSQANPVERQFFPTSLQFNLWQNQGSTGLHHLIIKVICDMLSHDASVRPSCNDIEVFLQTHVLEDRHIMHQISSMSLTSQSSSSSSDSDNPESPMPDMELYNSGSVPAVIHHSSTESSHNNTQDWMPNTPEELPNIGVMAESSQGHMSAQNESSENMSTAEMTSENSSSMYSSNKPQQSQSGDAMHDYMARFSQRYSQMSCPESQLINLNDGAGDHNYQFRKQPAEEDDDVQGILPLTISSAGSMMNFDSKQSHPVQEDPQPEPADSLTTPIESAAEDDSSNNTSSVQADSTDILKTFEPVESSLIEVEQVDFDPNQFNDEVDSPFSPPPMVPAAAQDDDDDEDL